jgi:hypothetical protein
VRPPQRNEMGGRACSGEGNPTTDNCELRWPLTNLADPIRIAGASCLLIGVYRAGYSFREELPIFLLIFLLLARIAIFVKQKFL